MSQEYLNSTISSFFQFHKKSIIIHPTSYVYDTFRIFSSRIERGKKKEKKEKSVSILDGEGGKKRKGRGGEDRIFWRMAKAVDTRFAERRHEACRASTTLASRRRCPTRGGGSVYRVTSSNVRRPRAVAVQFPSFLYRASPLRDRDMWRERIWKMTGESLAAIT